MSDAQDMFAQMMGGRSAAPQKPTNRATQRRIQQEKAEAAAAEAEGVQAALEEIAGEKLEAESRAEAAEAKASALEGQLEETRVAAEKAADEAKQAVERARAESEKEITVLKNERASLQRELEEAKSRIRDLEFEKRNAAAAVPPPPVKRESVGQREIAFTLKPFETLSEKFVGEVREHILEVLREALRNCRGTNRERREMILESVLAANESNGELVRRREDIKLILKDADSFNDESVLKELGKLGFRFISGKNHWKLEYAGIRITLPKTPSDHRSNLNAAADIAARVY